MNKKKTKKYEETRRAFCISFDMELYKKIKEEAKAEERLIGPQIRLIIGNYFKNKEAKRFSMLIKKEKETIL